MIFFGCAHEIYLNTENGGEGGRADLRAFDLNSQHGLFFLCGLSGTGLFNVGWDEWFVDFSALVAFFD